MELSLSKSETEVVHLKALGYSEKQIANKRFRSIHTVKKQVKDALTRNAISNGFELVARYAANHPNMFKNAIVVLFLAIQGLMFVDFKEDNLKRTKKPKTKLVKAKLKRGKKIKFDYDIV